MDANELKQHIVDTYGLQPRQVWIDISCSETMIRFTYSDSRSALWVYAHRSVPIDLSPCDCDAARLNELIGLLQIAKSIIEKGVLQ